jgi:predicted metalloprotease with PDZ domain
MLKSDFHTPLQTDLLWVYEGLTQYLGELLEARSGLMTSDEFQHRFTLEVRHALLQQGRDWRSLADTGAASHLLRDGSPSWARLRRSQDYYMEGMLFWLEVDAILREQTGQQRSLDEFCRDFFAADAAATRPRGFTREDIVAALNRVAPYDWSGLIARRMEAVSERFEPTVVDRLGYAIQYSNTPPSIPGETYRHVAGVDAYDSLGCLIDPDGTVRDVLLSSPADKAGLGPGMKIMGVNGHVWSANRMHDAIAMSATRGDVECLLVRGDSLVKRQIDYRGGPRFMTLVPVAGKAPLLPEILRPLPRP